MMVELDVANLNGVLAPGMYPTVDWPLSSSDGLLFVPSSSVVTTTERTFVILSRNGHAHWVNVKKGLHPGSRSRLWVILVREIGREAGYR